MSEENWPGMRSGGMQLNPDVKLLPATDPQAPVTAVGDDRDDLTQQVASALRDALDEVLKQRGACAYKSGGGWRLELHVDESDDDTARIARAVLASGLVTPVQPLRELADQFERRAMSPGEFVTELREKLPPAAGE